MENIQDLLLPYEDMLKAGMHFGRKKTVFNPGMGKYVFSVREGISIIDLLKTQEQLKSVIAFIKTAVEEGKLILFAAPTAQSRDGVKALAEALGMPYVLDRWIGGTLTNFKVINSRVRRLEEMEKAQASGGWDKYTKKERVVMERDLAKMKNKFDGLKKLTRMPDVVFVSSVKEGKLAIAEATKMGVTRIGVVNTDANPRDVHHAIPANDRSKMSLDLLLKVMLQNLTAAQ
jgi:small subunit ribosomal protein S2